MGLIRWVLALAILSIWAAFIGTSLYVAMYDAPEEQRSADTIIVLGGSMSDAGAPIGATLERIETAAALYADGKAERVVLTSGSDVADAGTVTSELVAAAVAAGIPEEAVIAEGDADSTLQNALFTADMAETDRALPVILVTHRYHAPRAWASFRWAGYSDVSVTSPDAGQPFAVTEDLLWESVKWPFNIARAAAASVAMAGDVPRENYVQYLE